MPKDPICGMEVALDKAIKLEKDGKTYFFCSRNCEDKFLGKKPDEGKVTNKAPLDNKATINITGMHCSSCVVTIENALKKLPGVSDAKVNFTSEKAYIDYDTTKVTLKDLHETINKTGYKTIKPKEASPAGGTATLELKVIGMDNPHCLSTVNGALNSLKGIAKKELLVNQHAKIQ